MEDEKRSKTAFAALLYKQPGVKPFEAALSLFPDTADALMVSQTWPRDPFVLEEIARFAGEESDEVNRIPGKEELSRKIWGWLEAGGCMTMDEKIKAAKLYAELNSFIAKPEAPKPTEDQRPIFAVMQVTDHGEDVDWERKLLNNQNKLQDDGLKEIEGSRVED